MRLEAAVAAVLLSMTAVAGCSRPTMAPAPSTSTASHSITPMTPTPIGTASPLAAYAFPERIEPEGQYLLYLHGRIVEDEGLAAEDPTFGAYEYEAILEALGRSGLIVISELREPNANVSKWADRIEQQVRALRAAGVPAEHITVAGASKGSYIAALVSSRLEDPRLNFVLLGSCWPGMANEWQGMGLHLYGNVLGIRDEADTAYAGPCDAMFALSKGKGLGQHDDIVLHVGTGHGILYHPLDGWIAPTQEWASR